MPTPKEVIAQTLAAIARREAQLKEVVGRVSSQFDRLRNWVQGATGGLDLQALQRQIGRLLQDLGRQTKEFERVVTREINAAGPGAITIGQALVDEPLVAAGLIVSAPDVTLPLLQELADFTADRVTNLSADMINQISLELRLGALGAKPIYEVITAITDKLRSSGADDAGFGSLAARGEAITRTELGRIHSMSTQRRMEQALAQFPDLMKEWRHSGNLRHPRDGHVALSGVRVPVRERFLVAATRGGSREAMLHPRDPAASSRNVVRCRCDCVVWRPSWGD